MSNRKLTTNSVIKNTINTIIKQISIIAIFISLAVIALLYIGPDIKLDIGFQTKLALTSGVLAISSSVLYELWLKNGRIEASNETEYRDLLKTYSQKSDGLHYPTLQEFLDYERQRRYDVEYDRLDRILEREKSLLEKMEKSPYQKFVDKIRRRSCKRRIRRIVRALDRIKIYMPYEKSEEFDYMRYSIQDIVYKEYSPKDTNNHLIKARTKKYSTTLTLTIVGFNFFSIGSSMTNNLWQAAIMFVLAALSLLMAVIGGFSTGYNNIKIVGTGVYNTANSFLDQAVAFCRRHRKDLYYKGLTEFREYKPEEPKIVLPVTPSIPVQDIFTKATIVVTETH